MGTEIGLSFSALRAQLENEKSSLYKIDENIKKIVQTNSGRFQNDRFNQVGEYARGGRIGGGGRNSFPDAANNHNKIDEHFGKRKQETKTVFSRLSARVDSDEEEMTMSGPAPMVKRVKMPSAVSRELPTRAAVLRAQGGDELAKSRNRRMFGSLLGTLQKFKQEEIVLQTKEEKKAQVERKIEEAARIEKEREHKERKTLFAEREHKKATIKALEAKMGRVAEFERWETSQKHLSNFILTTAKPHVYWLPKKMTEKAAEKLLSSRTFHEKYMTKKREELQEELQRIEQRVLRPRGPLAAAATRKGNHPEAAPPHTADDIKQEDGDSGKKRDKFAMDVDKEDSDADDVHDDVHNDVREDVHSDVHNDVRDDVHNDVHNEVRDDVHNEVRDDQDSAHENLTQDNHQVDVDNETPIPDSNMPETTEPTDIPAAEDNVVKDNDLFAPAEDTAAGAEPTVAPQETQLTTDENGIQEQTNVLLETPENHS